MKKYLLLIPILIYLVGAVYLLLPTPVTPDLSSSDRSDEEGDTWQHPDQKAWYTQRDRWSVISEMQQKFSLKADSFIIPGFRLNHQPEDAGTLVRDQTKSNYLEEIVHPLRESLFVNGWEPQNSPQYSYLPEEDRPTLEKWGRYYYSKVTIRPVTSTIGNRLLIWTLIFPSAYLVYFSLKQSINGYKYN